MSDLHKFDFRGRRCPHCGRQIVRTLAEVPEPPAVGDVAVCTNCEKISILDHDLRLRPLTKERMHRLRRSKDWAQVQRAVEAVKQANAARPSRQDGRVGGNG